jgi:hypothetical protein
VETRNTNTGNAETTGQVLILCTLGRGMCLHKTNAEHGQDLHLLLWGHLELEEHRQGQGQDNEIESNFQTTADETKQVHVNLASRKHLALPSLPKERDGPALEYHGESIGDTKTSDEDDEDFADGAIGHDTQVERQDGQLTKRLRNHVKGVREEEPLAIG